MRTALITGITGQTGSYLAELLLQDNYKVYGMIRRCSSFNTERIDHLYSNPNLKLIYGDLSDTSSINSIMLDCKPEYVFNLGAMSHVKVSYDIPEYTCDVTGLGVVRLLESIRKYNPKTRFYQASSSELMGNSLPPQNENTKFDPRSPYAVAKLMGYSITKNYRESYSMFASNGILFNHESERRGETFVTRKITRALGRIYYGLQTELSLGNLEAKRDWGHSKNYAEAQKMILEADSPDDFVIASEEAHTVREFLEKSFSLLNLDPYKYVKIDPNYFRPSEVNYLLGDCSKAKKILGWKPTISFDQLIEMMVKSDLELARKESILLEIS